MPILENANTTDNAEQNLLDNDALEENGPTAPSHFKRKKHSKIDSSLRKSRLRPLSGDLIGKACSRTYLIFLTFFLSIFSFVRFFMIVAEIQHPARREFENQPYICLVKVCIGNLNETYKPLILVFIFKNKNLKYIIKYQSLLFKS